MSCTSAHTARVLITNKANKVKNTASKKLRAAEASGTPVDITSANDLRAYFMSPLPVLNTWTLLLVEEMPGGINQHRASEAHTLMVVVEKLLRQTVKADRGYVLLHGKKSLGWCMA